MQQQQFQHSHQNSTNDYYLYIDNKNKSSNTNINSSQHLNKQDQSYIKQQMQPIINNQTNLSNTTSKKNIPMRVRNRRYKKLLQLRKQGFFDQQQIKLRHPLLYYLFVGQYQFSLQQKFIANNDNRNKSKNIQTMQQYQQKNSSTNSSQLLGLSTFLQSHLVNLQYKQLLGRQMSVELQNVLNKERQLNEGQINQLKRLYDTNRYNNNRNQYKQNEQQKQSAMIEDQFENSNIIISRHQHQNTKIQFHNPNYSNCFKQQMQIEQQQQLVDDNDELLQKKKRGNQIVINKVNELRNYTPCEEQINHVKRVVNQQNVRYDNKQQHYDKMSYNQTNQYQNIQQQSYPQNNNKNLLSIQQRQLQQQHLIEYCEQLFLQGKLYQFNGINYNQIDNNQDYDDQQQWNRDKQEEYFGQIENQIDQDNLQSGYYTGIQDY